MALQRSDQTKTVLVSIAPGNEGFEFRIKGNTLVLDDGSREYVFTAQK